MFKTSLDGKNLEVVLAEFGCEIYGVLYEHIQHFAVSDTGAFRGALQEIKCWQLFVAEIWEVHVQYKDKDLHVSIN